MRKLWIVRSTFPVDRKRFAVVVRGGNLADAGNTKDDVYALVDNATVGSIVNADISASAAIVDTKLATISTANKVNTSAITTTNQAAGDVLYNNGSGWVRLAKDEGKYLKSGASAVSWDTPTKTVLGALDSKSDSTAYEATTDGFVLATSSDTQTGNMEGLTDSSNPPTTKVISNKWNMGTGSQTMSFMFPVKSGNYWKTTGATTVFWMPLS